MLEYEFRWRTWRCSEGHLVARQELWYIPGREPEYGPEPEVPEYCPACGSLVSGVSNLETWDMVERPVTAR